MVRNFKNFCSFKRALADSFQDLASCNLNYISFYDSNKKFILVTLESGKLLLYINNRFYFGCPLINSYLMLNELFYLLDKRFCDLSLITN